MSESVPSSIETAIRPTAEPAKPTPLTRYLVQNTPALALQEHHGCQTPACFDARNDESGSEVAFALHSAAVMDLGGLKRTEVTGEDGTRWLAGMTTNAVQTLVEGAGCYNFVLNAQGRIQGDLYAFREPARMILETTLPQVERLLDHFERFIIMDDVELRPLSHLTALGLAGPDAEHALGKLDFDATQLNPLQQRQCTWNGIDITVVHAYSVLVPRYELWFAEEHVASIWNALLQGGSHPVGVDAAETLRVLEGTPAFGIDILDKHLAQETSQMRALNFSKGCYLGQEIVERIRSRASIHRLLKQFAVEGATPAAGTELQVDGKVVGTLTSVATLDESGSRKTFALGTIRTEALITKSPIQYDGGTAIPLDTPPSITGA